MSQPVIQTSFNAGEWAPPLNARVDLQKYHSGAALLRNFFIDYRGGATTRPGTRFINQCLGSSTQVRLIPFQASFTVSYVLEFGQNAGAGYLRFYSSGAPVLEPPTTISAATQANPGVITDTAHGYAGGEWIFISGVAGMTQLNGNYFLVTAPTANTYTLRYLDGTAVDTTAFGAYTSGGTAQRVYTIASPYLANELSQVKFAQDVNLLVLCHPNHAPYVLTLISATNWTLAPITFGSTVGVPNVTLTATTLGAGTSNLSYIVTANDANGQESAPTGPQTINNTVDLRSNAGSNSITWNPVVGAVSYNVYKSEVRFGAAVPAGAQFGFVGNLVGTTFIDSNITPDFSQGPPIPQNPFAGTGVQSVTVTAGGSYTGSFPTITFTGGGGSGAAATPTLNANTVAIVATGFNYAVNDTITLIGGVVLRVTGVSSTHLTSVSIINNGAFYLGDAFANPQSQVSTSGSGFSGTFNLTVKVSQVNLTSAGTDYATPPTVVFSSGAAAATAVLGAPSSGNPTVPAFFQQRLILAGPPGNPQQFNMSQPGSIFNFNTTFPTAPDNAIQETLVSGKLNTIKSMLPMPSGLVVLSDQQAWLINGGSAGSAISALDIVANSQAYNGANDLPLIVANYDILYVQSKSSIVRDLAYNFYTNVYAGTNISVLSSHLFFGFTMLEWAWAEEPFKIVWIVRSDGQLLSLTFQKDQEMIAWSHHDTAGGLFKSIATVTENLSTGPVDAIYTVVQRTINGVLTQYVERQVELLYPSGFKSSWFVDAGISYNGAPATTFSGARHLAGLTVTGVADGLVIPQFVMPANGTFTLGVAASQVTVGIPIVGQIQTLALDLGEPTVQGKRKKIAAVTVRAANTLGLSIGRSFSTLVSMKDFVLGNVGTMTNQLVTDLVTGDARTIIDPLWDVPGQYCIQQSLPYPASVLGVIPEIQVGDTLK